jgi:hypothetical protein
MGMGQPHSVGIRSGASFLLSWGKQAIGPLSHLPRLGRPGTVLTNPEFQGNIGFLLETLQQLAGESRFLEKG